MNRKLSILLLALTVFILAACGGDSAGSGNPPALDQTYDQGGLGFKYPSGWIVEDDSGGQVYVANSQATLDKTKSSEETPKLNAGEQVIAILPVGAEVVTAMQVNTPADVINSLSQVISSSAGSPQFGTPTETTIGGKAGAKTSGTGDATDGLMLAINMGDSGYIIVFGIAAKGEISKLEPTITSLAETVTMSAAG